jgi:autotransporter translocation and assembly factor TamB
MVGGIGVGSGGTITGLSVGGVGVGAAGLKGVALSIVGAGAQYAQAIVLTGGYFKIEEDGRFDGGAVAAITNVRGVQHGLTIGLFNYTRELHGAQVGLINVSDNDDHRRVLPLLSIR